MTEQDGWVEIGSINTDWEDTRHVAERLGQTLDDEDIRVSHPLRKQTPIVEEQLAEGGRWVRLVEIGVYRNAERLHESLKDAGDYRVVTVDDRYFIEQWVGDDE